MSAEVWPGSVLSMWAAGVTLAARGVVAGAERAPGGGQTGLGVGGGLGTGTAGYGGARNTTAAGMMWDRRTYVNAGWAGARVVLPCVLVLYSGGDGDGGGCCGSDHGAWCSGYTRVVENPAGGCIGVYEAQREVARVDESGHLSMTVRDDRTLA